MLSCVGAATAGVIEGQVFDDRGQPLAGVTVSAIERTGGGLLHRMGVRQKPQVDVEILRGTTDRHGFFALDTGPRTVHGRVIVRCYDPKTFDAGRYRVPEDRDVTEPLADRGRAIVACRIADAPGRAELEREIERVGGPASPRGRILQRQGRPVEVVSQDDGLVLWRYANAVYVFRDGALVETRPVAPVPAASGTPLPGDAR